MDPALSVDERGHGFVRPDEAVPKAPTRVSPAVGRAYERFLELPVALVLAVMWLVGAALLGSVGTALWLIARALMRMAMGAA